MRLCTYAEIEKEEEKKLKTHTIVVRNKITMHTRIQTTLHEPQSHLFVRSSEN